MTRFLSLALACLLMVSCATRPSRNIIRLSDNGDITLNGVATNREELPGKLDKRVPVLIQVPPRATHGDLVAITKIAQQAGVRTINVAAEAVK